MYCCLIVHTVSLGDLLKLFFLYSQQHNISLAVNRRSLYIFQNTGDPKEMSHIHVPFITFAGLVICQ
jgi:hypothetical protein